MRQFCICLGALLQAWAVAWKNVQVLFDKKLNRQDRLIYLIKSSWPVSYEQKDFLMVMGGMHQVVYQVEKEKN